jgi:hypothetical protein
VERPAHGLRLARVEAQQQSLLLELDGLELAARLSGCVLSLSDVPRTAPVQAGTQRFGHSRWRAMHVCARVVLSEASGVSAEAAAPLTLSCTGNATRFTVTCAAAQPKQALS